MKLRPEQLSQHLSRQLAPVYLVAGEEPLLVQESADAIRARAREQGYAERDVMYVESGFDWRLLSGNSGNLSLFSSRRLLELRLAGSGPGQEGAAALSEYLAAPPPDTMLLLIAGKLDGNARNSSWFNAFDRVGVAVYIWPFSAADLPRWVEARLRRAGLSADAEAVELLTARTEGNLLACAQDIDKLRLLCPDGRVTSARIREAVADSTRFDAGDLMDKALRGEAAGALQSLRRLKEEGEAPVLLIWTMARDLRWLYRTCLALQQGESVERAMAAAGVWAGRKPAVAAAARRFKPDFVLKLIRETAYADQVAKGAAGEGSVWEELVKLTARLAGLALPGSDYQRKVL